MAQTLDLQHTLAVHHLPMMELCVITTSIAKIAALSFQTLCH